MEADCIFFLLGMILHVNFLPVLTYMYKEKSSISYKLTF